MTDQEVGECVWLSMQANTDKNLHTVSGTAVDLILKSTLLRKSLDNVTCVLIVFQNFENCFHNNVSKFPFSSNNSLLSTFNTLTSQNKKLESQESLFSKKSSNNMNTSTQLSELESKESISSENNKESLRYDNLNQTNSKIDKTKGLLASSFDKDTKTPKSTFSSFTSLKDNYKFFSPNKIPTPSQVKPQKVKNKVSTSVHNQSESSPTKKTEDKKKLNLSEDYQKMEKERIHSTKSKPIPLPSKLKK